MFNSQALSDPGPTAGAGLLGAGISSLISQLNQKSQNKNLMARSLLNELGAAGRTAVEQQGLNKRTEMQLPQHFAAQSNTYYELAKKAEDVGNYEQAATFRAMGDKLSNQSYNLVGDSNAGSTSTPLGSSASISSDITGSLISNSSFAKANPVTEPSGIGVSQPIQASGGISITGQTNAANLLKAKAAAAKAGIALTSLESYDKVASLPEGSKLKGAGGIEFKGTALNPGVRSMLEIGKQELGGDPKNFLKARSDVKSSSDAMISILNDLGRIEPVLSKDLMKQMGNTFGATKIGFGDDKTSGAGGVSVSGLSILKKLPGSNKKDLSKLATATAAQSNLQQFVPTLAKNIGDQVGALSNRDVAMIQNTIGTVGEDPEKFAQSKKLMTQEILPRLMRDSLKVGDAYNFNRLQDIYTKIVGQSYVPGSEMIDGNAVGIIPNIAPGPSASITMPQTQRPAQLTGSSPKLDLNRINSLIKRSR